LKVEQVTSQQGKSLDYTQKVVAFPDDPSYTVNYVQIDLNKKMDPKTERNYFIKYSGTIDESHNKDGYVRDSINPEFSYIRTETSAYPMICYPNYKNRRQTFEHFWTGNPFDYRIKIIVPKNYVVANIGRLVDKNKSKNKVSYTYENILGAWRIDIMVAKYVYLNDPQSGFKMFCFPEDLDTGKKAFEFQQKAFNVYSRWFGPLRNTKSFTVIQTPGWDGGQNDVTGAIQSGKIVVRAFSGYAHEISHSWGPNTLERHRWINEGQASYLQYRVFNALGDEDMVKNGMSRRRDIFIGYMKKHPETQELTLANYTEKGNENDVHVMNYHKGAWVYYLLDVILGETIFNRIISSLYSNYADKLVSNQDFIHCIERISGRNLTELWEDWIYTNKSNEILLSDSSIQEIINKYIQ